MNKKFYGKVNMILAVITAFIMLFNAAGVSVYADAEDEAGEEVGEGKYVSDVYVAYGKTEDEAREWLKKNGWEPISGNGDFNAGKASFFDDNKLQDQNVAAVLGIRRTDKASEAVTDMAVMNMKGGYSFPDYESLVKEKKTEIDEFIDTFIPVLNEYRKNYNGKGSNLGKKRAELAHDLLNRFYDGGEDEPYAENDTGKPLGDLFLSEIRQEDGGKDAGDMQQIILESSGPAVTVVEVCLALAADCGEETWLERLNGLTGDELAENLEKYVPEAEGQDVAPSAVNKFLSQHFGDQAKVLASQWDAVRQKMLWLEAYNDQHDLWQHDGEDDEAYAERLKEYFDELDKKEESGTSQEHEDYTRAFALYNGLYEIPYEGEWGETLGDFFNPSSGTGYADDKAVFLPFAAALSEGQRAAVELVSLETLLMLGMSTEESIEDLFPEAEELFKGADSISIYSGMNRGIFRGGVALTSTALMEKNQNSADPFADMWSFAGIYNISVYAAAILGVVTTGAGIGFLTYVKGSEAYEDIMDELFKLKITERQMSKAIDLQQEVMRDSVKSGSFGFRNLEDTQNMIETDIGDLNDVKNKINECNAKASGMTRGARITIGIGGALLIAAAMAKGYQLYRHYNTTFTQIPMYIVDEADIVTYEKDAEGNESKLIEFDQFVYYSVVRCNRQEVGEIGDWQSGVSEYAAWGCGDASDLNADMGQQWLALYAVKSHKKGYPILADSLTLKYGDKKMPEGCSKALHMFTYESAADLGDTAYAYNNEKGGIYFFWGDDEEAYDKDTASAFAGGTAAISGGIGLLIGILGTALVMRKKRVNGDGPY